MMMSWPQDEDPVQLPSDEKSGKVDYIEFDTPTELLVTLLKGLDCSATVDRLCKVNGFFHSERTMLCQALCNFVASREIYVCRQTEA